MSAALPELLRWDLGGGNLAGEDTGREHISHTALALLLNCPQKYAYRYEEHLEPIRRPEPLTLGKAYQLAIEHGDPAVGASSLREDREIRSQQDEDLLRVQEAVVVAASGLYLSRWPTAVNAPSVRKEFEYRVRLRNPFTGYLSRTFDLLGYADEVVFDRDRCRLVENKLVGQITETQVRRLPLDRQVALEAYGVWRATGQPVTEVNYRFVRKPSIKQRQKETIDEFCDRLLEDYTTRPDFYLHEETWLRDMEDLVRIEIELWEWVARVRDGRRAPIWPRNTSACTDYGGCPFIPLCLGESGEGLYRNTREEPDPAEVLAEVAA